MSSKGEERKERTTVPLQPSENEAPTTASATTSSISSSEHQRQREEQQHSIIRALDDTKENIRKTIDEARNHIPHYTQAVNDYKEQTIQAVGEIADNFLESQKEILNSFQFSTQAWNPYLYLPAQKNISRIYEKIVKSLVDNTMATIQLANNMMFANMEVFKSSMKHATENTKHLARIGVNAAKLFEQTSGKSASSMQSDL
jgi:hypothetical protein